MKVHVTEIDVTKLTKALANLTGYAVGAEEILMPLFQKIKPQLVVSIDEVDYEILVGKERGELIAEFNRWIFKTKVEWAAEITAEKFQIKRVWIVYGAWNTLIVFI
jgi:hypothetical protein